MSTKTKSVMGALIAAVTGILAGVYIEDPASRTTVVSFCMLVAGVLGFKQPGQA